ncbi:winged helix-turn-helix transcriptional regulator [Streptomyces sp. NPDC003233]
MAYGVCRLSEDHRIDRGAAGRPHGPAGQEERPVISRRRHCGRPPRYEYHLAQAGHVLLPVMPALREWGDKRAVPTAPLDFQHLRPPGGDNPRCRPCDASVLRRPDRAPPEPRGA